MPELRQDKSLNFTGIIIKKFYFFFADSLVLYCFMRTQKNNFIKISHGEDFRKKDFVNPKIKSDETV
jgi:hypothetical protein